MKQFEVLVPVTSKAVYIVEAESKEDAIKRVIDGDGQFLYETGTRESTSPSDIVAEAKYASDWFYFVDSQLDRIKILPGIKQEVIESARAFISCLAEEEELPRPHVNPTDTGVQYEWEDGKRYFEIEFEHENTIKYYYSDSGRRIEDYGTLTKDDSLFVILDYIRRIN